MRGKLTLGVVGLVMVGMASACAPKPAEGVVTLEHKQDETVTITAGCSAGNQIDVAVDKWEIYMKKKGVVTFNVVATNGAVVDLTQKSDSSWPFTDGPPYKGGKKGTIKDKKGTYAYNVRVACALSTGGDSVRTLIDPDIFVD